MSDIFSNPAGTAVGYHEPTEKSLIVFLPKLLIIFAALTLIVNGALPQLEMALTGGSLPFMPRQLTLLMIGLGSVLLLKGRFQPSPLLPLIVAVSAYFAFEVLYLHFYKDLGIAAVRSSLEYFTFLLVACAASVVPLKIKPRQILGFLFVITFVCLVLSAAQFFTNSPIVPTESSDHVFHVQSYQFLNQTRGFSLFANGLDAGIFYSFMGGIATSFCLRPGTRSFGLCLVTLCAFGCYATYTRLVMIGFVVCAVAVFVMSKKGLARFSPLLPVFSLSCAVLLIALGLQTAGGAGRNDLANVASLDQRISDWAIYGGKFLAGSPADIVFGIGQGPYAPYSSPDRAENAAPIPIDNAYLLILLSCGISGLFLLGVVYWRLWIFLHKRSTSSRSHLFNGMTAMFATVPFFCSISDPPIQIILLLLLAVSLDDEDHVVIAFDPPILNGQHLKLA
jgi:hypothetical protein